MEGHAKGRLEDQMEGHLKGHMEGRVEGHVEGHTDSPQERSGIGAWTGLSPLPGEDLLPTPAEVLLLAGYGDPSPSTVWLTGVLLPSQPLCVCTGTTACG